MVLTILSYAIAVVGAVAALVPIRRWVRSASGNESLGTWPATLVIPLQAAIALFWLQALFSLRWIAWNLAQVISDPWWSLLRSAQVVFLLVFTPVAVTLVGDSWLKLHPLPPLWSLDRIWLGGFAALCVGTIIAFLDTEAAQEAAGLTFMFALLTTLFLTRWWLITHPIRREEDQRSSPPTA